MKQQYGLFLISLFLFSNISQIYSQSTLLLETLSPQGHKLDCTNRCTTCIDESTFTTAYNEYVATLTNPLTQFTHEGLQAKMKQKADALTTTVRRIKTVDEDIKGSQDDQAVNQENNTQQQTQTEVSDEDKINNELAKTEKMLDQEVAIAIEKVTKLEGTSNKQKIEEIAERVRSKMIEKYRRSAANKLGINYDTLMSKSHKMKNLRKEDTTTSTSTTGTSSTSSSTDSISTSTTGTTTTTSSTSTTTGSTATTTSSAYVSKLYVIYFPICVESGEIFYA